MAHWGKEGCLKTSFFITGCQIQAVSHLLMLILYPCLALNGRWGIRQNQALFIKWMLSIAARFTSLSINPHFCLLYWGGLFTYFCRISTVTQFIPLLAGDTNLGATIPLVNLTKQLVARLFPLKGLSTLNILIKLRGNQSKRGFISCNGINFIIRC